MGKKGGLRGYLWGAVGLLLMLAFVFSALDFLGPRDKIAVIRVEGEISDFSYAELLDSARRDSSVKAVVVEVNSPGGTVQACFETETAMRQLALEKPVVVTMKEYAASGAYLLSSAASYIFARSSTLTAGLGVIAIWVSYENWLEKEGIKYYRWSTGQLKDLGAEYRSPTPEENQYLQSLVENLLRDVMDRIRRNRPRLENVLESLKDGSTVYGTEALSLGLVDNLGTFRDAVDKAEELADLREGSYRLVYF
ncbi:MAG: signal peptide peptidase SppA [Candidatus Hadarchaeales archaeon]